MNWLKTTLLATCLLFCLCGCSLLDGLITEPVQAPIFSGIPGTTAVEATNPPTQEDTDPDQDAVVEIPVLATPNVPEEPDFTLASPTILSGAGKLIVVDAGHQRNANYGYELIGPDGSEYKYMVASGTSSPFTGLAEYELTLAVSLKLEAELESRGYDVVMIRTTNDVNISNAERATIANELEADAFLRIHANGSDNSDDNGAFTICQTPFNPYCGQWYFQSRILSDCVLNDYIDATGFAVQDVWETDTMTGINWSQVPVTILEMGYMTNESDDSQMADEDFQSTMVAGIADGLDQYFALLSESS